MPIARLNTLLSSDDHSGTPLEDRPQIAPTAANALTAPELSNMKVYHDFLNPKPMNTSFRMLKIKFHPKIAEDDPIVMSCEPDKDSCEEQCRTLFSTRPALMEKPCIAAVKAEFGRGMCFPALATVHECRRGIMRMADVEVGDEIMDSRGSFSQVVAMLHNNTAIAEVYLQIHYNTPDGHGRSLLISPQHLVRTRLHGRVSDDAAGAASTTASRIRLPSIVAIDECLKHGANGIFMKHRSRPEWSWTPAEDIRQDDELVDEHGKPVSVRSVDRVCVAGAFAPLTASGQLLVNGVLCSCYAPPAAWTVPHSACHAAMLPVRLLENARSAVERLSSVKDSDVPLFTVDAVWLLPRMEDATLHPWASGLLRMAICTQSVVLQCKSALLPAARSTESES